VGALSSISGFSVASWATAQTTFYPLGYFASTQGISASAWLYGDVEFQGGGATARAARAAGLSTVRPAFREASLT
jgi:hypothetical protein